MGGPVEVGLLEHGGDLGQQPPGGQDGAEDGLLGFQVVRWLPVGFGHRAQPAPGRWPARFGAGHRRGLRGPLPRRREAGCGPPLVEDVFDVALGDLQALGLEVGW